MTDKPLTPEQAVAELRLMEAWRHDESVSVRRYAGRATGQPWAQYADLIDAARVAAPSDGLRAFLHHNVGCASGLDALLEADYRPPCDCGLVTALAATEAPEPGRRCGITFADTFTREVGICGLPDGHELHRAATPTSTPEPKP